MEKDRKIVREVYESIGIDRKYLSKKMEIFLEKWTSRFNFRPQHFFYGPTPLLKQ